MGLGCIFLEWAGGYEGMQISKILRVVEMGIYLKIETGLT